MSRTRPWPWHVASPRSWGSRRRCPGTWTPCGSADRSGSGVRPRVPGGGQRVVGSGWKVEGPGWWAGDAGQRTADRDRPGRRIGRCPPSRGKTWDGHLDAAGIDHRRHALGLRVHKTLSPPGSPPVGSRTWDGAPAGRGAGPDGPGRGPGRGRERDRTHLRLRASVPGGPGRRPISRRTPCSSPSGCPTG